jgi:hypothetical protein
MLGQEGMGHMGTAYVVAGPVVPACWPSQIHRRFIQVETRMPRHCLLATEQQGGSTLRPLGSLGSWSEGGRPRTVKVDPTETP